MIGISFEIRSGGTDRTTIDFRSTGYQLLNDYYPHSNDGASQITEDFEVLIWGSSAAELEENVRDVELALDFAREHPTGPDGVWMLFTPDDGTLTAWQSRLSGGTLIHDQKLARRWRELKVKAQVVIERAPWWETEDPVTLELTNRAGTGNTGAIVNHQDAGATDDIYVEIAADQVTGGLPAPAVIEYTNTTDNASLVDHLVIGHFAASAPLDPPAASSLILEGSGTADANCSGGEYLATSWTGTGESQLTTWTIASAAFRHRNYKFLARLRDTVAYTDLWLQARLLMGTTVLAETRWSLVEAGQALQLIGSIQIPPFRFGQYYDLGDLTVGLYEKRAGGAGTMNLDFVALLPQDSWRKFEAIGGLAYNETLVDDPTQASLITDYSTSSHKITHLVAEGEPVMLRPGVKNVLYFLHDLTTGTAPIARTATVAIKYHPRRRTV